MKATKLLEINIKHFKAFRGGKKVSASSCPSVSRATAGTGCGGGDTSFIEGRNFFHKETN